MRYRITSEANFLRADLFHRETPNEAREFFGAVAKSAFRRHRYNVLISEHASRALFTVDRTGFFKEFTSFGTYHEYKIALVADSEELAYSHLEFVGRQRGINVRGFRSEQAALDWLKPPGQVAVATHAHNKHPQS